MFGLIVSSRPVTTELQTVSETQFAFNVQSQPPFHHIVVFVLPGQTLPETHAAAVYIQIPPAQDFKLLGALAAQKPSAIFKIGNTGDVAAARPGVGQAGGGDDLMMDDATLQPPTNSNYPAENVNIIIGLSVEPIADVQQQLDQLRARKAVQQPQTGTELVKLGQSGPVNSTVPTKILAQRVIKNAFNYLSSFAEGPQEMVSMKKFQQWWDKFQARVAADPSFLEKQDDG